MADTVVPITAEQRRRLNRPERRRLGAQLCGIRKKADITRDELSERAGVSVTTISEIERGTGQGGIECYLAIARALDTRLVVDISSGDETNCISVTVEDYMRLVSRREFNSTAPLAVLDASVSWRIRSLFADAKFPMLPADEVDALATDCDSYLWTHDNASGGGSVLNLAIPMHDKAKTWFHQRGHKAAVACALERLHCDLGVWCGWLALDAGDWPRAELYLKAAIADADLASYAAAKVRAMENMALLALRMGQPEQSLKWAHAALRVATGADMPCTSAALHMRGASAYAYLGDRSGFEQDRRSARDLSERGPQPGDQRWARQFTPTFVVPRTALGYVELGQPDQTVATLHPVVENPVLGEERDNLTLMLYLARALAKRGDYSQAAEVGFLALPEVAAMASGENHRDLHELYRLLSQKQPWSSKAREFIDAYDAAVRAQHDAAGLRIV